MTEDKRIYEKKKRNLKDRCNICGKVSDLTWDHVPPKFCFNNIRVEYNSILEISQKSSKSKISQNGIKYRSICSKCNNQLLGGEYDKEYKKLVDKLYELYVTPGEIGQYVIIEGINVNKIARAIVGHLLAARNEYLDGKSENELRSYFLNPNLKPPSNLKLLYYVYIYNTIMIIRDVALKKIGKSEYVVPEGLTSCINSFPIAFILTDKYADSTNLYDMFKLCTENINETTSIKIDLLSYMYSNKKTARNPYWPCNVSDDETGTSIMLFNDNADSSVFSKIRELKK